MKRLIPILLLAILISGFALRIYDLQDAPLDYHATRQLHSALIARGMYAEQASAGEIEEWQRLEAIRQMKLEGIIEPPIMEWLASRWYLAVNGTQLWIPRLLAIIFWLLAALGIVCVAKDWIGWPGAIGALIFFLFYPYGVIASRSFQPESLLLATLIWGVWALLRWQREGTWKWAILAGIFGGLALLVKAVSVFFLFGAWVSVILIQPDWKKKIKSIQPWVAGTIVLLPTAIYTLFDILGSGNLAGQFGLRFFPSYWRDISFYVRWFFTLRKVVAFEWLLAGIVGWMLLEGGILKRALIGLWIGYFLLGLTLSHHIATHDYYSLPALIMVSLGSGALFGWIWQCVKKNGTRIALAGLLATTALTYGYEAYRTLKRTNFNDEIAFWIEMGNKLGRDAKVTALSEDYGYRLEYWGWVTPTAWMSSGDFSVRADAGNVIEFEQYFQQATQGSSLFLVTDLHEFEKQPQLKQTLEKGYELIEKNDRMLLFDLTRALK